MKKVWYATERIPDVNYVMIYHIFSNYGKRVAKQGGGDYLRHIMWIVRDGIADLCYIKDELNKTERRIFNQSLNDPGWLEKNNKKVEIYASEYLAYAKSFLKLDFLKCTNKQLINNINRLLYFQVRSHGYGQATTWLIELDKQLFSSHLIEYLKELVRKNSLYLNVSTVFSIMTTPLRPSFVEIENKEILELTKLIGNNKVAKKIFKTEKSSEIEFKLSKNCPIIFNKIKKHHKKWFWLHYSYRGPVLELEYFLQIIQGLIRENDVNKYLVDSQARVNKLRLQQNQLFNEIKPDQKYKRLFEQARYIVWLKSYRKDCMYFGAYVINQMLKELAKRLSLSFNQVEFMTKNEYGEALFENKFNVNELNQRFKFSIIYGTWNKVEVYTGKKAKDFLGKLKFYIVKKQSINELTGQTACPGKAKGVVRIIETVKDMTKMQNGDIMLSETTYPALVTAMKKAGAIVTNIGGLTCHAAIVSRELNIPCVVGTKIANRVFKDGDIVEVDANNGIIKKIK